MRPIPTLYLRGPDGFVTPYVNPAAAWVIEEGGMATRKWNGVCVMYSPGLTPDSAYAFEIGHFDGCWGRREVKPGKTEPAGFILIENLRDWDGEETGWKLGWEPCGPRWQYWKPLREALSWMGPDNLTLTAGCSYELIGPKVCGNPERITRHALKPHGRGLIALDFPLSFEALRAYTTQPAFTAEGIVWHHRDGQRMAKLKRKDFN